MTEILTTSAVSIGLTAAALWLCRTWIATRLTADIRLENDTRIEELKSQLQRASDSLSNLASAGHTAYSQSQVALLPHRINAIETVWNSVLEWNQMATAAMFVAVTPIDWVRRNGSDPSTKQTFETLLSSPEHLSFLKKRNETELVRPLISDRAWALYAAYSGLYISRVSKAAVLLIPSMDHAEIWERIDERSLVVASAPADIIRRYDANILQGTTDYLNYLKDEMLAEFRAELSGARDSEGAVSNASTILEAAEKLVRNSTHKPEETPESVLFCHKLSSTY